MFPAFYAGHTLVHFKIIRYFTSNNHIPKTCTLHFNKYVIHELQT